MMPIRFMVINKRHLLSIQRTAPPFISIPSSLTPLSSLPARVARLRSTASHTTTNIRFQPCHIRVGSVRTISTSSGIDMPSAGIVPAPSQTLPSRSRSSANCDLDADVGVWTGRAVFVSTSERPTTPCNPSAIVPTSQGVQRARNGTVDSPISVSDSPTSSPGSSTSPLLPRPRAIPHYSSPISRTAYTPPSRQNSSSAGGRVPPVHPFFSRDFTRSRSTPLPPPTSQRPRMVADYSSTSDSASVSASQETRGTESTWGSQRVESPSPSVSVGDGGKGKGKVGGGIPGRQALSEREMEEIIQQVASVDLTGKFRGNPWDGAGSKGKGKDTGSVQPSAGSAGFLESSGSRDSRRPAGPNPNSLKGFKWKPAATPDDIPAKPSTGNIGGTVFRAGPSETVPADKTGRSTLGRYGRKPTVTSSLSGGPAISATTPQAQNQVLPNPTRSIQPISAPAQTRRSPSATLKTVPKSTKPTKPTIPTSAAPFFDYRHHTPSPPTVAYTTSLSEADDLLSCLKGPVLGMDLEWPVAGKYKVTDPRTGAVRQVKIGMTWDEKNKKWIYGQGRTALIQVCDERLIVLIHLREGQNSHLPQKFIDIMQDPTIYKTGVQVRGDGIKLHRDFPTSFPLGLTNLLELTYIARKVDPVGTGPGGGLISLANLCLEYTGKQLKKENNVRKSNWVAELGQDQKDYAANDVYSSLQVYLSLRRLAEERGVNKNLDLDACSHNISPSGTTYFANSRTKSRSPSPSSTRSPTGPGGPGLGPTPAQQRTLDNFRMGLTMDEIATEQGIKRATVEGYLCRAVIAVEESGGEGLTEVEKKRMVDGVQSMYVTKQFGKLLRKMRRELGEEVRSDTEGAEKVTEDTLS